MGKRAPNGPSMPVPRNMSTAVRRELLPVTMDRGRQGGVNGNGDRQSPVSNKNDRKGKEIDA